MARSNSTSEPWRVGVLFSQTGVTAVIEETQLRGTLLAIEEINAAGGVNGRELVPIDLRSGLRIAQLRPVRRTAADRGRRQHDLRLLHLEQPQGGAADRRAPQRAALVSDALRRLRVLAEHHLHRRRAQPEQRRAFLISSSRPTAAASISSAPTTSIRANRTASCASCSRQRRGTVVGEHYLDLRAETARLQAGHAARSETPGPT